jgi:hypothetical protein
MIRQGAIANQSPECTYIESSSHFVIVLVFLCAVQNTVCQAKCRPEDAHRDLHCLWREGRKNLLVPDEEEEEKKKEQEEQKEGPIWPQVVLQCTEKGRRKQENGDQVFIHRSVWPGDDWLVEEEFRPMILSVRRGKESLPLTSTGEEELTKKNKGCKVQNHVEFWFCPGM